AKTAQVKDVVAGKPAVKKVAAEKKTARKAPSNRAAVSKAPANRAAVSKAPAKRTAVSKAPAKRTTKAIREWAIGEGLDVSSRGRISAEIVDAFHLAQAKMPAA
ncbi:MAG: Lsr2 family DNA-binding protein, partial [Pseudonocardiaceae bacterium]